MTETAHFPRPRIQHEPMVRRKRRLKIIRRISKVPNTPEEKSIRRVRTSSGVRRFGQPLGTVIVKDALPSGVNTPYRMTSARSLSAGDAVLSDDGIRIVMEARVDSTDVMLRTSNVEGADIKREKVKKNTFFKKLLLGITALAVMAGLATQALGGNDSVEPAPRPQVTVSQPLEVPEVKLPAPTSAKAYNALWASVDTAEWGAADVSISVGMPDGRSVWLYGDTLSGNNGFVNSTAITQDGGSLHVSNGGKQLLPKGKQLEGGAKTVYWIEEAKAIGADQIAVTAGEHTIGTKNVWDFKRTTKNSKVAIVELDDKGNVEFVRWDKDVKAPVLPQDFKVVGKNHFTYSERSHSQMKLSSGNTLWSKAQNWDDAGGFHKNADGSIKYEDYRPIFYEIAKKGEEMITETKGVRRVATPAGVRKFGQPIGTIIVRDVPLKNLTVAISDFPGWNKYFGSDGKYYYTGKSGKKWYATNERDEVLHEGKTEDDVTKALNDGVKTRLGYRGVKIRKASGKEKNAVLAKRTKPIVAPPAPKEVLQHIKKSKSEYSGYEKYRGSDGEDYYIAKNPKTAKWYATDANDTKIMGRWNSYDKDEVVKELDSLLYREEKERNTKARLGSKKTPVDHWTLAQAVYNTMPGINDKVQITKDGKKTPNKGIVIEKGWAVSKKRLNYPYIKIRKDNKTQTEQTLWPMGNPKESDRVDEWVVTSRGIPPVMAPRTPKTRPIAPTQPVATPTPPVAVPVTPTRPVGEVLSRGGLGRAIILQSVPLNGFTNTIARQEKREADIDATLEAMDKKELQALVADLRNILPKAHAREKGTINAYIKRLQERIKS